MNVFDLNSDNIIMNIEGKDIEMRTAICYGKEYDRWLVSKCGKVWSFRTNRLLTGSESWRQMTRGTKVLNHVNLTTSTEEDFWEDGSGAIRKDYPNSKNTYNKSIQFYISIVTKNFSNLHHCCTAAEKNKINYE